MIKRFGLFLCMAWIVLLGFSEANTFYSISNEKIISQNENKVIIKFDITNNTSNYYPELSCVPVIKIGEKGDKTSYSSYYEYDIREFSLEPYEKRPMTFECKFPKNFPYKNMMISFEFYSMSGKLELTKEFYFDEIYNIFDGFLENTKESYWKMADGKKIDINTIPCIESSEIPEICMKLKSTFDKEKRVYPQYYIYDKYENKVVHSSIGDIIIFKANEEKEVLLNIPRIINPGNYLIKFNFIDENGRFVSNLYNYEYTLAGESAKISDVIFDSLTNLVKCYIYGPQDGSTLNTTVDMMVYDTNKTVLDKVTKNIIVGNRATIVDFPIGKYNDVIIEFKVSKGNNVLATKALNLKTEFTTIKTGFPDIVGFDCEEAVRVLNGAGIINGYLDNTFKPDNLVTRAEFAAIVIKLMDMKVEDNGELLFPDTYNHWGRPHINALYSKGLVSGYTDGTFGPQNNVTYAEAITILINALGYRREVNESNYEWPDNYIFKAIELGILEKFNIVDYFEVANRGSISKLVLNTFIIK